MARPSSTRLLRPLLWLLWVVLLAVILPLVMIVTAPIFLLIWAIGVPAAIASRSFREQMGVTALGMALWLPFWALLLVSTSVPALALAHAATLYLDSQVPSQLPALVDGLSRQLPRDLQSWWGALDPSRREWAWLCVVAGVTGVSSHFVYAFIEIPWRLKQIRQVRTLPRSKTRSAAIGLAEFEGTARATSADGYVSKSLSEAAQPFHLEDETGRILVDPRGATVRPRSGSGASLQVNEIEEGIRDGDRVYVIGNVQNREAYSPDALDADRLVVRPLGQSLVSSPIGRLIFPDRHQVADRDAPNIFIVDKGHEHGVALRLRMALWDFCAMGAIYLAASLWLVHAAWPWLTPAS